MKGAIYQWRAVAWTLGSNASTSASSAVPGGIDHRNGEVCEVDSLKVSGQKFLHNPLEAERVVQKDMVVGVRNLGQFEGRTLGLGFNHELRRNT
jgi:hypothetical protein